MDQRTLIQLLLVLLLSFSLTVAAGPREEEETEELPGTEPPVPPYTEEVEVVAQAPDGVAAPPLASLFVIERETIETVGDYDLAKPFLYTTGAYVSTGSKNESDLRIRGLDSGKIALLYDGIPIYEPYFGSFDLNSIAAEGVESVKIAKGTTSVLYGPNVLGGAVNVLTRRPDADTVSAVTSYGSFGDTGLAATGTLRRERLGLLGSVSYNSIDDFEYKDDAGDRVTRPNSDYETRNVTGKLYYNPSGGSSEIMAEAGYVTSEYGLPWATEIYRARYWRFSDWDRYLLNVGGSFPLAGRGYVKARGYYVKHHNVLDAYASEDLTELSWQSTFNNYSYGASLSGSMLAGQRNEIKFSAHAKSDQARTQDDVGTEWQKFSQRTFSLGAEEHFRLNDRWLLMAGVSADRLDKEEGYDKTAVNPIAGFRYSPGKQLTLSGTFSQKSRFPTMKDLYSSTSGNPDLREERSTNWEVGFAYERGFGITGAVFYNSIDDLIQSIRMPDGWRVPTNVGRARIAGFELGLRKDLGKLKMSVNYTFLDSEDRDTGQPLPLVPRSQINYILDIRPRRDWTVSFWAAGAMDIETLYDDEVLAVPDYVTANLGLARRFDAFELSARVENLSDASYVTEPGFPMPGRTFRLALRLKMGRS
jgi:iron complex outermembrane receptor protein